MNQDREPEDPNVASEQQQQQAKQPATNPSDNPSDAKQPEPTTSSSNNSNTSTATKDDDEDEDVTTATNTTTDLQQVTVVSTGADADATAAADDEKRPSLDAPSSSPLTSATKSGRCPHLPSGDSTEPDEEEDDDDDEDDAGNVGEFCSDELGEGERNKLRKRISELANNFASAKQFQQMCDNIDAINDAELRALIRELKRKIEFAERMNWMYHITY